MHTACRLAALVWLAGTAIAAIVWDGVEPIRAHHDPLGNVQECHWGTYKGRRGSFPICLRAYKDLVSDRIKRSRIWPDCEPLLGMAGSDPTGGAVDTWYPPGGRARPARSIFVDVGANLGACSLLMANAGYDVVSFEPVATNLFYFTSTLLRNPELMERVTVFPAAVGDRFAMADIYTQPGNRGNSVIGSPVEASGDTAVKIHIRTLDSSLWPDRSQPPPDVRLMKLDAQGYEVHILQGARALLEARAIRHIKTEVASAWLNAQNTTVKEFCEALRGHGFVLYYRGRRVGQVLIETWNRGKHLFDMEAILE